MATRSAGTTKAPVTSGPGVTKIQRRWVLILGSLTSFLVGLDALVVTTALPTLHEEFGASVSGLGWTINAYALAFAASILTGSTVGDRFGRRRVFVIGLLVFTMASALCALSPDIGTLIWARALQGIGGGIALPIALALITDATPPEERGKFLGIWGAVTGLAVAAGPLVGGAVVEGVAWQYVFWLNVPVGATVAALALRNIPRGATVFRRVDSPGLALGTLAVFGIAQALIRGNDVGWGAPSVFAGLIGGPAALALFVAWERRTETPMVPTIMFRDPTFTAGCVAGFVLMAGVFGFGFLTAQYLQLVLHHDPLGVGVRLLPATAVPLLASPLAGRIADRVGERPLVVLGLGLMALGLFMVGALVSETSGYGTILGPLFVIGAGIAIAFPTVASAVMRAVPPTQTGIASGVSNTLRQIGAVFGVAVSAALFTGYGGYGTPTAFVAGMKPAFIVLGLIGVIGAVTSTALRPSSARK